MTNIPYKRKAYTSEEKKTGSNVFILTFVVFLLLFVQAVYVIQVSMNANQLKDMIDQTNSLKIKNQILESKIAQVQDLHRVQYIAQTKYSMQPVQKVIYLNSSNLISYNKI